MSIFDELTLPNRELYLSEMKNMFNELALFVFDVGRVVGFHEDLKDYYWVVRHSDGSTVYHSAVGGAIGLRGIDPGDYKRLDGWMSMNGAPEANEFSITKANRAANIAMYGDNCFRGDVDSEITEENYLINLWYLLNELDISEDNVPSVGRVDYTRALREKAYAAREWADLYKLDVECVECGKGKYVEATLMDSFSGRLTCTACRNEPPKNLLEISDVYLVNGKPVKWLKNAYEIAYEFQRNTGSVPTVIDQSGNELWHAGAERYTDWYEKNASSE
jgi:hypothetical protein